MDEAARLLSLPVAALSEELEKMNKAPSHSVLHSPPVEPIYDEDVYEELDVSESDITDTCIEGKGESASYIKPPPREFALMEFLMSHEYDSEVDALVGLLLPEHVLLSEFTQKFVSLWREEVAQGTDMFADFAANLQSSQREWFDRIILNAGRVEASSLGKTEIFSDFVRLLWCDYLKRERSLLKVNGGTQAIAKIIKISTDLKRLISLDWAAARDLIIEMMKGEP